MIENKQPVGCFPKWIVAEQRTHELRAAIERYEAAGIGEALCVWEWREELREVELVIIRRKIEILKSKK